MKRSWNAIPNLGIRSLHLLLAVSFGTLLFAVAGYAQSPDTKPCEIKTPPVEVNQTVFLKYASQQNDLNDIQTDLRNMFSRMKIYGIPSQYAITMRGTPDDIALAVKLIADLDRPKKTYRLTYTITETDSGKPAGAGHYAMIATSGERQIFKQGDRIPIFVGTNDAQNTTQNPKVEFVGAQVQYQDVGLMIDSIVQAHDDDVVLRSKVEQSNVSEDKSGVGTQDPIIRQSLLEGTSTLVLGKPRELGALDIPGSTRKLEVQVEAELVK